MNESQLIKTIKAHIAKGDHASEKAEQHYIAAGQHLKTLKDQHGGSWAEWEELLKTKVGIGKSRASELMQIADGRKTVAGVAAATTERSKKHRALSPLRNGENAGEPEASAEAMKARFAADDDDGHDQERDRKECIALDAKVKEAERERAQWLHDQHGGREPGSWHVEITDDDGKVWSSGVRLATKDEAMRHMALAVNDFISAASPIVAMRVVQSADAPNMCFDRYKSGPHKGRFNYRLVFEHGTCHLFGWHEEGAEREAAA
jgi:hypothetical protein